MPEDNTNRVERWAGPLTGLVGAAVTMIGMTMTDIIALGGSIVSSGNANARILAENKDRLGLGTAVLMIGLFLLVWFLVHLQTRLNPTGNTRWMASVASVGGLITVTLLALVVAYVRAGIQSDLTGEAAVIAKAIAVVDYDYFQTFAPFISAHLLASGLAIVRTALLPKIMGWGAFGVAFVPLVLPPGMMTGVFVLWVLVLSTGLFYKGIRSV